VDHEEAGGSVRARGQGFLAVLVALAAVTMGILFTRVGPKVPAPAAEGTAPSGGWLCPHGGGKAWQATIYLANPGASDVTARLTSLTPDGAEAPVSVTVPAGGEVAQPVNAAAPSSATFVEFFGGWVAAGWLTHGGEGAFGAAAEPCAPEASRTWYVADNTTQQGQVADLVIMNPFGTDAVFDVVLFTAGRAPIRDSAWSDLTLKPHHSLSLRLNDKAPGEEALTAEIDASSGRVAVASVGINARGGVRSSLGRPDTGLTSYLPVGGGAGRAQLALTVPGGRPATLGGTLYSRNGPKPLAGLVGTSQDPQTAKVYPLVTSGPSVASVLSQDEIPVVTALRASGLGNDPGATSGVLSPSPAWVLTPTVAGEPSRPGLVVMNPGSDPVEVTLHLLAPDGATPAPDVTITIPAASAVGAPAGFLASAPTASVAVTAAEGGVVALGASTSLGGKGVADYAIAMGVVVPSAP
jgi:Family of unknown function (DUF5719)